MASSVPGRNAFLVAAGSGAFWIADALVRGSGLYSYQGGLLVDIAALGLIPFVLGAALAAAGEGSGRWANGPIAFLLYYALLAAYIAYYAPGKADFSVKFAGYALQFKRYALAASAAALVGGVVAVAVQRAVMGRGRRRAA